MEDQAAICQLKQGDRKGLETLVKKYQAKAVHTAYLILFDPSLAEDVVQAAFIKISERIYQFDPNRPFAPWFFRIIVNDALKLAKKQNRYISLEEQLDKPASRLAKWLTASDPDPEHLLELKETQQIILSAVQSLPPDQRAVIVMQYFLDMNMTDISRKTGQPLSTIKWWLRDARKRLLKQMNISNVDRSKI